MPVLRTKPEWNGDGTPAIYKIVFPLAAGQSFFLAGPGFTADFAGRYFPTLEKLCHTLGGVVPFSGWSTEAQAFFVDYGVHNEMLGYGDQL